MKKLSIIFTMLFATSSFAGIIDLDSTYTGKGNWVDAAGKRGTFTTSINFKDTCDECQNRIVNVTEAVRVMNGEEILMDEAISMNWQFTRLGRFLVLENNKVVGKGRCIANVCRYTYKNDGSRGMEKLTFYPRKNMVKMEGRWMEKDSRGSYAGCLKKVIEGKDAKETCK